ncbi:RHS repeat-associated core domain-containing protein [Pseudomonas sp. Z5-35]
MSTVHSRTPNVVAVDGRGLPARQIAYLRNQASAPPTALITRQRFNVAGQLVEQWDPRLFGNAPKPNQATVYNLLGEPLHTDSVDAGWRLALPGLAGETLQLWDARGSHWRTQYDEQLRPVALEENGQARVDTFTYADASDDAGHNLRRQLLEQTDPSGTLRLDSYGLLGMPLRQARVIAASDAYVTEQTFDALGALIRQTDAGGHHQDMRLDVAGQLIQVSLQLKQDAAPQPLLLAAQYNAAGQIERQDAANGVISRWAYDPADGRLSTLQAGKPSEAPRQNLAYVYDPVGNVLRIEDLTVTTVHFANQRVDGHRDFTYDSLYRLTGASGFEGDTPHLQPGLPAPIIPIDPNRLFNYSQRYEYDVGNNLTRLRHVREGNNHTQIMRIDPNSNRGVRWTDGDPEPDFNTLFDAHGNQRFLQAGTPELAWNPRDQLSSVTVIQRDNSLRNDDETYLYSQGERVEKNHTATSMARKTHYLPGLEIRTSSDGEVLHVITLGLAYGSVRCLHWEAGQPGGIEADQLRYSLDEPHGSSSLELDRAGDLISLESFYPFGGTAWQAGRSLVEAGYKTIRYSGKEMDTSGLYYYGTRYYAPWLQRWVSTDPAGDIDGLNLYGFVTNNPMTYADGDGLMKLLKVETQAEKNTRKEESKNQNQMYRSRSRLTAGVTRLTDIMKMSSRRALEAQTQLANHRSGSALAQSAAIRIGSHVAVQATNYGVSIGFGVAAGIVGSALGPPGAIGFGLLGFTVGKGIGVGLDYLAERTGASASVKFKSSKLSKEKIVKKQEYKMMHLPEYAAKKTQDFIHAATSPTPKGLSKLAKETVNTGTSTALKALATTGSTEISALIKTATGAVEIVHEIVGAGQELTEEKLAIAHTYITGLIDLLNEEMGIVEQLYDEAGIDAIGTFVPLEKLFGKSNGTTRVALRRDMEATIGRLRQTQSML